MKKNKTPKQKEQEDFSTALLDAIVSASKGQSIFDAFLGKKSTFRKYVKSVSFKGTQKLKL